VALSLNIVLRVIPDTLRIAIRVCVTIYLNISSYNAHMRNRRTCHEFGSVASGVKTFNRNDLSGNAPSCLDKLQLELNIVQKRILN